MLYRWQFVKRKAILGKKTSASKKLIFKILQTGKFVLTTGVGTGGG